MNIENFELSVLNKTKLEQLEICESQIDEIEAIANYEVGRRLQFIRDKGLYKEKRNEAVEGKYSFQTWEEYLEARWGKSKSWACRVRLYTDNQQELLNHITSPQNNENEKVAPGQPFQNNNSLVEKVSEMTEKQSRPIRSLPPEEQASILQKLEEENIPFTGPNLAAAREVYEERRGPTPEEKEEAEQFAKQLVRNTSRRAIQSTKEIMVPPEDADKLIVNHSVPKPFKMPERFHFDDELTKHLQAHAKFCVWLDDEQRKEEIASSPQARLNLIEDAHEMLQTLIEEIYQLQNIIEGEVVCEGEAAS